MGWPAPLELALFALSWAAALAIGSVHPPTQVALAAVALLVFLAQAFGPGREHGLRLPPITWVGMAAFLWTALQLLPLPPRLLGLLSAQAAELRVDNGLGWAPITLDAPATTLELAKQLSYLCVLIVGGELLRKRGAHRTAASLGLLGLVVGLLIAVHRGLGAERIYGLYTLHSRPGVGFYAPFVNGNHAASLLALAALSACGLAVASQGWRRVLFVVAAAVSALATVTTSSRGGVIGLAAGAMVLVTRLATARFGSRRGLLVSGLLLFVLGAGVFVLADGLRARFSSQQSGGTLTDNQKTRGWLAGFRLARAFPLTGVGRGAFEAPVALVRPNNDSVRLVYPENLLAQCLSEWGYPLGLGLLLASLWLFARLTTQLRFDAATAGLVAGLVAVAVHELFDFGLEFPGVAMSVALAAAAVMGRAEGDGSHRRRPRPRLHAIGSIAFVLVGVAVLVPAAVATKHTLAVELAALRASVTARDPGVKAAIDVALTRHPASEELEVLAGEEALRRRDPSALRRLGRAMWLAPGSSSPHQLAALELLRLKHPKQAALELRLAIERGGIVPETELVRLLGSLAIDATRKDPEALLRLAAEYAARQRWDDLERAYLAAAQLDPGPMPRQRWLALLPPGRAAPAAEAMARAGTGGEELALAIAALSGAGQGARAEAVLADALVRYPDSAALLVAGARLRAQRGDLDGARQLIGRSARFDTSGRVLLEEVRVELAEKAGDLEAVYAAKARLRLLRARADLDEPLAGETK